MSYLGPLHIPILFCLLVLELELLLHLQSGQKKEESAVIPGLTLQGGAGLLSSLFSLIPATHTPPEAIILNGTISKSP